jgi:hypothetical protein
MSVIDILIIGLFSTGMRFSFYSRSLGTTEMMLIESSDFMNATIIGYKKNRKFNSLVEYVSTLHSSRLAVSVGLEQRN